MATSIHCGGVGDRITGYCSCLRANRRRGEAWRLRLTAPSHDALRASASPSRRGEVGIAYRVGMIAHSDQTRLRELFAEQLGGEVRVGLRVHGGECSLCARADGVLGEVAGLSDRVALLVETGEGALPEIRLEGRARGQVRFVGMPSGYEFPTLIDSIVDVSRGRTSLSPDALARLDELSGRVPIRVFTTPT